MAIISIPPGTGIGFPDFAIANDLSLVFTVDGGFVFI